MLVKICGLRRIADIEFVNELKPDFIGFVFALNKMRTIDINTAKSLKNRLISDIKAVGVFRNNDINYVKEVIDSNSIDMIQLHGDESDEYIKEIKDYCNLPIIKAYKNSIYADYVLYDNEDPGKGLNYDKNKIKNDKPFFLAGGISISSIDDAKALNPYCIDVSSSVETGGYKDYLKMKEFIRRCRL